MDERGTTDLSILGIWIIRSIACAVAILGAAGVLGLAWRLFGVVAG